MRKSRQRPNPYPGNIARVKIKRKEHWHWENVGDGFRNMSWRMVFDPDILNWLKANKYQHQVATHSEICPKMGRSIKQVYFLFEDPLAAVYFALVWGCPVEKVLPEHSI